MKVCGGSFVQNINKFSKSLKNANRSFNSITFPNFSSILHALTKVEEAKFMVFPYGKLRKVPAANKKPPTDATCLRCKHTAYPGVFA